MTAGDAVPARLGYACQDCGAVGSAPTCRIDCPKRVRLARIAQLDASQLLSVLTMLAIWMPQAVDVAIGQCGG